MVKKIVPWMGKTLSTPAAMVSLTIFAIGGALLFFIAYAGIAMNRAASAAENNQIQSAFSVRLNRTLMEQRALTLWNSSKLNTRSVSRDNKNFGREMGEFLTEGYGHDAVFLLSPENRILYGFGHRKPLPPTALAPYWRDIQPMIRQLRTGESSGYRHRELSVISDLRPVIRHHQLSGSQWAAHILKGPDGPVIVSIMTITPAATSDTISQKPFLALSIVDLNEMRVKTIGGALQIDDLQIFKDYRPGAIPLIADNGTPTAYLSWNPREPGKILLSTVLPIFIALLLGATFYVRQVFGSLTATQRRLEEQELNARFMALHDGLSQLPNRRHFTQTLREQIARSCNDPEGPRVCVAYVDVDHFKTVNDAIGHSAGDALVIQIGPRLRAVLRQDDLLARLGGDEFAILRLLDSDEDATVLGETIMSAFKRPFDIGQVQMDVTASIGIAIAARGESDPERVVQDADISLYSAKDQGRNRFVVFQSCMAEEVRLLHELENDLRAAIGTDQIVMYYQPIVSARSGEATSVEALVRWRHPTRGLVSPDDFITIAERSGLMVPLGDHIIEMVLREANRFGTLGISINLSPAQLRHPALPFRISELCRRYTVDPSRITLEVTENILIEASSICGDVFKTLRHLGFKIALDDFGTGYSSLGYLNRFVFDKIKIDRSFVSSGSLVQNRPIIEAVVHIGRGMKMEIVAEGVESDAEFFMIRALGCTEAQGFGISRPKPIEEILDFLATVRTPLPESPNAIYAVRG